MWELASSIPPSLQPSLQIATLTYQGDQRKGGNPSLGSLTASYVSSPALEKALAGLNFVSRFFFSFLFKELLALSLYQPI